MGKKSFKEWLTERMRLSKAEKFSLWFGIGCCLFGLIAWGYYFIFQAAGCV